MHGHGRATALHSLFLKYLGRTRGVQKCGATPHGSRLSRGALLLTLQQPHDTVDVDGKAGPASLQAPTGERYSTPCGTPSPTAVKRTRKPYSESRDFRQVFIPRNLAFDARSSQNNTRWAVTPGSYPPIFIGVSRSIHIVMGVYPKVNQIYTPISKEFPTPTRWLQPCRPVIPVAPSFR